MLSYRQQIETLEEHLASTHQPNKLTPDGIFNFLQIYAAYIGNENKSGTTDITVFYSKCSIHYKSSHVGWFVGSSDPYPYEDS
jgi:hypothetical protein